MRGFFNQTDQIADPCRSLTAIRFYERLAITKHRLSRIYHHLDDVIDLYLKRWREKDWDEKEEQDTTDFLELEKEIYKEMYPHSADVFNEDDEETYNLVRRRKVLLQLTVVARVKTKMMIMKVVQSKIRFGYYSTSKELYLVLIRLYLLN